MVGNGCGSTLTVGGVLTGEGVFSFEGGIVGASFKVKLALSAPVKILVALWSLANTWAPEKLNVALPAAFTLKFIVRRLPLSPWYPGV